MRRNVITVLFGLWLASFAAGQTPKTPIAQKGARNGAQDICKRLDELQRGLDAQSQSIDRLQREMQERD